MLTIIAASHPVLTQAAKPVMLQNGKPDKDTLQLLKEMKETLANTRDPEGVGLAAPQVGKLLQIFLVKPSATSPDQVFINPIILASDTKAANVKTQSPQKTKKKSATKLEGCLSLPAIWGEVTRNPLVRVSYIDQNGRERTQTFRGFAATIIQHEYDHLQGILFPRRVLEQKGKLFRSRKNKEGEDVFDEIAI